MNEPRRATKKIGVAFSSTHSWGGVHLDRNQLRGMSLFAYSEAMVAQDGADDLVWRTVRCCMIRWQ